MVPGYSRVYARYRYINLYFEVLIKYLAYVRYAMVLHRWVAENCTSKY